MAINLWHCLNTAALHFKHESIERVLNMTTMVFHLDSADNVFGLLVVLFLSASKLLSAANHLSSTLVLQIICTCFSLSHKKVLVWRCPHHVHFASITYHHHPPTAKGCHFGLTWIKYTHSSSNVCCAHSCSLSKACCSHFYSLQSCLGQSGSCAVMICTRVHRAGEESIIYPKGLHSEFTNKVLSWCKVS